MLRSPARFQQATRRLVSLYREHSTDILDPSVEDDVVRCYMDAEAYALSTYQTASRLVKGGSIGPEASCNKIFWSELDLRIHDTAMRILGPGERLNPKRPRWRTSWALGSTAFCLRSRVRFMPGPTRFNATLLLSGCSACRGARRRLWTLPSVPSSLNSGTP